MEKIALPLSIGIYTAILALVARYYYREAKRYKALHYMDREEIYHMKRKLLNRRIINRRIR